MKRLTALIAVLLLLPCLMIPAYAQSKLSDGWTATFDGSKIKSNFSGDAIDTILSTLQPGDDVTVEIKVTNDYSEDTDWYMSNEVLKSLEETRSDVHRGTYSYKLTYIGPDGTEKVFFDSDAVGGDQGNINDATQVLNDYFFMDTLKKGQSGKVRLKVAMDGETDSNSYQDTLAKLKINFAVEKKDGKIIIYKPKTGDLTYVGIWGAVFLVSVVAVVAILATRAKKKKKRKGGRKK